MGGPPPRIAFLVDWLEDPYQSALLAGAAAEAARRGATLVALPGGIIGGPTRNGVVRNYIYDLVRASNFEGAIVLSGTLGNQLGPGAVAEVIAAFGDVPVVSIGVPIAGHSSVLVDNKSGMRRAIEHLARDHGYRRIAFIRGPEVNAEAEARYQAYLEVLDESGIEFDPTLVLAGDFQREGGARAVATLLDERGVAVAAIDAIAAATDLMIMGAMDELERRGIHVPTDIGVVGFDDLEEVRYLSPPLTSVRQPLAEQGIEAVRLLLGQLTGGGAVASRVLETHFIRRRSCGCRPREAVSVVGRRAPQARLSLSAEVVRARPLALAEMTRAARGSFVGAERGWEDRLWSALSDEFETEERQPGEPFRSALEGLLVQVIEAGGDITLGHDLVSALRSQLWAAAGDDPARLGRVEDLLHDARILISTLVERSQVRKRLEAQAWARLLGDVSVRLSGAQNRRELRRRIAEQMPRLGIGFCLVLGSVGAASSRVKLEIAWAENAPVLEAELGTLYPALDLLPPGSFDPDEPRTFVVMPLTRDAGNEAYGYLALHYAAIDGYAFEILRELLTAGSLATRFAD